jgi:ADP-ribose pyrophosphatase
MSNQDWQEVSREEIFRKFGRGIEKRVYKLPKGNEGEFYLYTGHASIACLALTEDKQVILAKQFRPGPFKVLLEMPGGRMDEGETKEESLARELLEETGYKGEVQFVGEAIPSAYAVYTKNFFVVTNCQKVAEPLPEDNGEEIEVVLMSLEDFRKHIRTGQLTDVEGAYLCLDFLNLL